MAKAILLKEENKEAKVEYYKVDEIPKFYTSQSIQLKSIVESIATSGKYVELKDRVPVIKNNFNQLYALTDKLDLKKEYPETLFEFSVCGIGKSLRFRSGMMKLPTGRNFSSLKRSYYKRH
ncbi:MAG: hypothetical protein IPG53_23635 [Ignavibacteriales bacterium]|nr:hypothetical protein [Ignavibacteriales bacterium]